MAESMLMGGTKRRLRLGSSGPGRQSRGGNGPKNEGIMVAPLVDDNAGETVAV
jgi:hypothetical protein